MRTSFLPATELTVTFIHRLENERRQKTWQWLEEMVKAGRQAEIPPVVVVRDPDDLRLLVYDGNIRVAYATQYCRDLRVKIITNQVDLDEYLEESKEFNWFLIERFPELLKWMRIYTQYPEEDGKISKMPEALRQEIYQLHLEAKWRWDGGTMGWLEDD